MPTANEAIRDALIRHQIGAIRASGTLTSRIVKLLNSVERDLRGKIDTRLKGIEERGVDLGPETTRRLLDLERDLREILGQPHREIKAEVRQFLLDLAKREPVFVKQLLEDALPTVVSFGLPPASKLRTIVTAQPFQGKVLRRWMSDFEVDDRRRMMQEIREGLVQGQSNQEIARRIFGTRALNGRDGAREVTRRQAKAIARTATNAIGNKARQSLYAANSDVIAIEVYVATLDSRTTMICASLDGRRFRVGKGPIPPLHINCRSTRVPSIDGRVIGQRPMKASTERDLLGEFAQQNGIDPVRKRADLPRGFKGRFDKFARKRVRELTGRVPASQTYSEFLGNQTKAFQEEVLGVERARLFREGQLELDSFVDDAGRPFSLDELMKREPAAFRNNTIALGEALRIAA